LPPSHFSTYKDFVGFLVIIYFDPLGMAKHASSISELPRARRRSAVASRGGRR
jgi:hypothetical protein